VKAEVLPTSGNWLDCTIYYCSVLFFEASG